MLPTQGRSSSQVTLRRLEREYRNLLYKVKADYALTEEEQNRYIWLKEEITWINQQIVNRKWKFDTKGVQ
jgi:hypothetical protein